jgi:RNA polymerase sigma factor for flagellar operon FliA
MLGLADALRKFGVPNAEGFEAYASYRIRGAMLEELRRLDPLTRDLRELKKRIVAAESILTAELGSPPDELEIAQRLNVSLVVLRRQLAMLSVGGAVNLDTSGGITADGVELPDEASESGEGWTLRSERRRRLAGAVEELPERLQRLLQLYYQYDYSLREVGEELGITESRACQLHAEALVRLRAIRNRFDSEAPAPMAPFEPDGEQFDPAEDMALRRVG